jgi:hypothetical protein
VAVLPDVDRIKVWAQMMREAVFGGLVGCTKADLRAAVDAADSWIESNSTAYNTALPQPFRGQATATQKTLLLCWVAMRRAGLHHAEGE